MKDISPEDFGFKREKSFQESAYELIYEKLEKYTSLPKQEIHQLAYKITCEFMSAVPKWIETYIKLFYDVEPLTFKVEE